MKCLGEQDRLWIFANEKNFVRDQNVKRTHDRGSDADLSEFLNIVFTEYLPNTFGVSNEGNLMRLFVFPQNLSVRYVA